MDSDSWCSPTDVTEPLAELFGGRVDTDPCSNPHAIVLAKRSYHEHGLVLPWGNGKKYQTAYANYPYSRPLPWIYKLLAELRAGNVTEVVTLGPVATSAEWWGLQCGVNKDGTARRSPNPQIIFTKRLKFIGDKDFGARFDTALFYFGRRHRAFYRAFSAITRWTTKGRS